MKNLRYEQENIPDGLCIPGLILSLLLCLQIQLPLGNISGQGGRYLMGLVECRVRRLDPLQALAKKLVQALESGVSRVASPSSHQLPSHSTELRCAGYFF